MIEHFIQNNIPEGPAGLIYLLILIIISLAILCKSADRVVESAVEIAHEMGIPTLIVGATIVSLGTTSPEAAVSVMSAIQGNGGLAIGNGIGSVICDLALILGLSIAVAKIAYEPRILKIQSRIILGAALVFCIFAWIAPEDIIVRWMGLVLVLGLAGYLAFSYKLARTICQDGVSQVIAEENTEKTAKMINAHRHSRLIPLSWMIFALVFLVGASYLLIPCVDEFASRIGIPEAVIASTLIAFGTSTPELMTAISALRKGHPELTLGNIMGADALNILFVIGVSATATPLKVDPVFYRIQAPFMIGMLLLFQVYLLINRNEFRRWQGILLVAGYIAFIAIQYIFR
jgi:cation:H+ antiporter